MLLLSTTITLIIILSGAWQVHREHLYMKEHLEYPPPTRRGFAVIVTATLVSMGCFMLTYNPMYILWGPLAFLAMVMLGTVK